MEEKSNCVWERREKECVDRAQEQRQQQTGNRDVRGSSRRRDEGNAEEGGAGRGSERVARKRQRQSRRLSHPSQPHSASDKAAHNRRRQMVCAQGLDSAC